MNGVFYGYMLSMIWRLLFLSQRFSNPPLGRRKSVCETRQ